MFPDFTEELICFTKSEIQNLAGDAEGLANDSIGIDIVNIANLELPLDMKFEIRANDIIVDTLFTFISGNQGIDISNGYTQYINCLLYTSDAADE